MIKSPLHILHLEDDPHDAALVKLTMEKDGIACATVCVQSEAEFVTELEKGEADLVLSDFSLPTYDGLSAIAQVRARWPDLPVILVSGSLGEETAIDSLKSGATDYVLKERLDRLAPAVRRAMREVDERASRRRLEGQYIEAQKMEVLGHLAAGVAHDFNNILGSILMCGDLITSGLAADSPLREYTKEIRLASERAVGLTRQLLIFSREEKVQPVPLDLNAVVKELEVMLRRLIDANITLTIALADELGQVMADSGYVGQVLMNLVVNARDAMPEGGTLTITTAEVVLDEAYAREHAGVAPGNYVRLRVRDTGTGMTEEVKAHLFQAFFTTKPAGKGTGLGLATCQTIVQESAGNIRVQSELGQGTTFDIHFPCLAQAVSVAVKPVGPVALPRGTETVLVVEDEPAVRHLAGAVLQAHGYAVLTAANGRDALHVVREHDGVPISLVITDLIMPLMGGKVMMEWLQTMDPALKVLFTSGYSEEVAAQNGLPAKDFLAKPYTMAGLTTKVREILDR